MRINKGRLILIICILSSTGLSFFVIARTFRDHIIFFYSISEYMERSNEINTLDKSIKIGGIVGEIIRSDEDPSMILFALTDHHHVIWCKYRGIIPALFKTGQGAVVTGKMGKEDDIFNAQEILAKHDELYIPKALHDKMIKDSLKSTGAAPR